MGQQGPKTATETNKQNITVDDILIFFFLLYPATR